jgi:hypothetical protein
MTTAIRLRCPFLADGDAVDAAVAQLFENK